VWTGRPLSILVCWNDAAALLTDVDMARYGLALIAASERSAHQVEFNAHWFEPRCPGSGHDNATSAGVVVTTTASLNPSAVTAGVKRFNAVWARASWRGITIVCLATTDALIAGLRISGIFHQHVTHYWRVGFVTERAVTPTCWRS
jgi:hypothetical protein